MVDVYVDNYRHKPDRSGAAFFESCLDWTRNAVLRYCLMAHPDTWSPRLDYNYQQRQAVTGLYQMSRLASCAAMALWQDPMYF
jgi:hypothetical protein